MGAAVLGWDPVCHSRPRTAQNSSTTLRLTAASAGRHTTHLRSREGHISQSSQADNVLFLACPQSSGEYQAPR
jgi:hypothetical protein